MLQHIVRQFQASQQQQQQQSSTTTAAAPLMPPPMNRPPATATVSNFAAAMAVLNQHQWNAAESALLVQFRAKCAVLDSIGREVAFINILQLQNNRKALLDLAHGIVNGPITTAPPPIITSTPAAKVEEAAATAAAPQ